VRLAAARAVVTLVIGASALGACSGTGSDSSASSADSFVSDVRAAATAVESALGGPQEYFEITATPQLTNVFVAVDGATAAIPYVYLDGTLQEPAPKIDGVSGQSFTLDAIDFDESSVLAGVASDLPDASIDALSVEGGTGGFVRYVVSARSGQGGVLDIVVGPNGAVIEVDLL
jgi:hypothetical protein